MNLLDKIILDASESGRLQGKHTTMAAMDIEAAQCFHAATVFPRQGQSVEEQVCDYFARRWCDKTSDGYVMKEPLAPAEPMPGLSRAERAKREINRWFHARPDAEQYTPVPTGSCPHIRAEVRYLQLCGPDNKFYQAYLDRYAAEVCRPSGFTPSTTSEK